jgi:hypothetical protein
LACNDWRLSESGKPGSKLETRNQKLEIGKERKGANRKLEVRNWKRREKTEKPQVEKRNLGHPAKGSCALSAQTTERMGHAGFLAD